MCRLFKAAASYAAVWKHQSYPEGVNGRLSPGFIPASCFLGPLCIGGQTPKKAHTFVLKSTRGSGIEIFDSSVEQTSSGLRIALTE